MAFLLTYTFHIYISHIYVYTHIYKKTYICVNMRLRLNIKLADGIHLLSSQRGMGGGNVNLLMYLPF